VAPDAVDTTDVLASSSALQAILSEVQAIRRALEAD
jgi:hypothetical protein